MSKVGKQSFALNALAEHFNFGQASERICFKCHHMPEHPGAAAGIVLRDFNYHQVAAAMSMNSNVITRFMTNRGAEII